MTLEQAKQIAEREYPMLLVTDGVHGVYNDIAPKQRAAFINGLTYDRWIKVTPETMPEEEVLCINIYGDYLIGRLKDTICEDGYQVLLVVTHWQPLPPKADSV